MFCVHLEAVLPTGPTRDDRKKMKHRLVVFRATRFSVSWCSRYGGTHGRQPITYAYMA